jgi:plastocyanin
VRQRLALAVLAAVVVAPPTAGAATKSVGVDSQAFTPASISIRKGDRITFTWLAGYHNVRRVSGPAFKGIPSRTSGSVTRKFTAVGKYRLVCTWHRDIGMYLTVRVRA